MSTQEHIRAQIEARKDDNWTVEVELGKIGLTGGDPVHMDQMVEVIKDVVKEHWEQNKITFILTRVV